MKLRQYQKDCIKAMWSTIQTKSAALVWGATGSGKTIVFTKFIEKCKNFMHNAGLPFNTMVLVHKIDLVEQTVEKFKESTNVKDFGIYCGSLNEKNLGKQITVASIQSVYKRPANLLPKINLLIVDEAHRYHRTKMYQALRQSLLINNPKMKVVYFTATPYDTKKGGFIFGKDSDYFGVDKPCYRIRMDEMVKQAFLCDITFQESPHKFDVSHLKVMSNGDFSEKSLKELTAKESYKEKMKLQIEDALTRGVARKKFIWCCISITHAEQIEKELMFNYSEKVFCIHSKKKHEDNARMVERFKKSNDFRHLVSVTKLSEGSDIPIVDCIVGMRPTRSPILYPQVAGRGMRPHKNKENVLYLDYGGVVKALGHPSNPYIKKTKENIEGLKELEPEKKYNKTPTVCPMCYQIYFNPVAYCKAELPSGNICNFEFPPQTSEHEETMLGNLTAFAYIPEALVGKKLKVLRMQRRPHKSKKGDEMIKAEYILDGFVQTRSQYFFKGSYKLENFEGLVAKHSAPTHVSLNAKGFVDNCFFDIKKKSDEHITTVELAKHFDVRQGTMLRWINRNIVPDNITQKIGKRRLYKKDEAIKAIENYLNRFRISDLARHFKINHGSVMYYIKKGVVPYIIDKKTGEKLLEKEKAIEALKKYLLNKPKNLITLADLGREFGVGSARMSRYMAKGAIPYTIDNKTGDKMIEKEKSIKALKKYLDIAQITFTQQDLSEHFGVSRYEVEKWMGKGIVPYKDHPTANRRLIKKDEAIKAVEKYLNSRGGVNAEEDTTYRDTDTKRHNQLLKV